MSEPWQELVGLAFSHADRLGLQLALAAGPGWCGTGGPWVSPDQSMQHLVASKTVVPVSYTHLDVYKRQSPGCRLDSQGDLSWDRNDLVY